MFLKQPKLYVVSNLYAIPNILGSSSGEDMLTNLNYVRFNTQHTKQPLTWLELTCTVTQGLLNCESKPSPSVIPFLQKLVFVGYPKYFRVMLCWV